VNWFEKICRNMGLMVHNIKHPQDSERKIIRKEVQEQKRGEMTLRRTTIEEIEIKNPRNSNESRNSNDPRNSNDHGS